MLTDDNPDYGVMPDDMQRRLAALRGEGEPDARRAAAEGLAETPTPEVISALVGALADSHKGVRDAVYRSLLTIGGAAVAREIVPFITSEHIGLRNAAADILSRIGEDSLEALAPYLANPDGDVRKMAVDIEGLSRSKAATPSLLPLLHDPDPNVVVSAAEALGLIGDARAVRMLTQVFDKEEYSRAVVAEALGRIGGEEAGVFLCNRFQDELDASTPDPLTMIAVVEALGKTGEASAFQLLCSCLPGASGTLRRVMVTALLRTADKQGLPLEVPGVTTGDLMQLLRDHNLRVRLIAMKALVPNQDGAVTAAFIDALGSSEYFDLELFSVLECREDALARLVEKLEAPAGGGNGKSLMLLLRMLVDRVAAEASGSVDRALLDRAFTAAAEHWQSAEEESRGTIVETLFALNGERALALLDSLLEDPDPFLRARVIELLSTFNDARLPEFLCRHLTDEDEMVRAAAAAVLEGKGYVVQAPDAGDGEDGDAP